ARVYVIASANDAGVSRISQKLFCVFNIGHAFHRLVNSLCKRLYYNCTGFFNRQWTKSAGCAIIMKTLSEEMHGLQIYFS
ncbi:MAG: hypothetical protein ACI4IZ_05785, partial [Acutalibacteraceae bacterium]